MAVTVTDNRTTLYQDGLTNITGASSTETTLIAESASCAAEAYNITTGQIYWSGTTPNFTTAGNELIYVWSAIVATQNGYREATASDSSHAMYLSDGTNDLLIYMAGNDRDVFKHAEGQVSFQCFLIDIDYLDTVNSNTDLAVTAGSYSAFDPTSTTMDVGAHYTTLSKALGSGNNCYLDIIRYGGATDGLTVAGGTTGDRGSFDEVCVLDRSTADGRAHGIIREYTGGAYGVQGTLNMGDDGTGTSYFEEDGFTMTFEDRLVSDDKYRLVVQANTTGTNVFRISNATISSARPGVTVDMSDSGINELLIDTCTFSNLLNAVTFPTDGNDSSLNHDIINSTFNNCGQIDVGATVFTGNSVINSNATTSAVICTNDADLENLTISGYEGTANTSALIYNTNNDTDGRLDGSSFIIGTASTHAIEFGTNVPTTMTLRNCDFSGYNASNNQNDSTFHFRDASPTSITLNLVGCTGNFSYRTDGADITIVADPVTTLVNVNDNTGAPLLGARVILRANGSPGTLPDGDSVTASRTDDTVTVTHTGHGLSNGNKVELKGFDQPEYNGVKTISNVLTNSYDFTVTSPYPAQPSGTATSTAVILEGTTDSSGQISDQRTFGTDQPVEGIVRRASPGNTRFKDFPISGIISSTTGLTINVQMILDE